MRQTRVSASLGQWQLLANDIIHELVGDDVHFTLGSYPNIRIYKGKFPNAFSHSQNHLTISSGLLDRIDSSEELAFVIAHELSHLFLRHTDLPPAQTMAEYVEREKAADQYALKLLKRTYFDEEKGKKILDRLAGVGSKKGVPLGSIYPSLNERILALN